MFFVCRGVLPMVLKFSQAQFDRLNDIVERTFEDRLVKALAKAMEKAPNQPDETELRELSRQGRLRGAALGITRDGDVAVFALFLAASSRFDKNELTQFQAWVTPYLQRESSAGEVKVALAEQLLRTQAALHPLAARICEMAASVRTNLAA
jgi:hypothetical protein